MDNAMEEVKAGIKQFQQHAAHGDSLDGPTP
jgi:hypothetical protein